jgi:hypothetical protein
MQLEKEQQEKAIQPIVKIPPLPPWPTSKAGPQATPPPPGQRPMPTRTDQMVEIAYNMETGVSSARVPAHTTPDVTLPGASSYNQQAEAVEKRRRAEKHKKAKR